MRRNVIGELHDMLHDIIILGVYASEAQVAEFLFSTECFRGSNFYSYFPRMFANFTC